MFHIADDLQTCEVVVVFGGIFGFFVSYLFPKISIPNSMSYCMENKFINGILSLHLLY